MTVRHITDLAPAVRRFTFAAPEFADVADVGPDEFFGLLVPRDGHLTMPSTLEPNLRRAVQDLYAADRPDLRWYTIRDARPESAEIDVDIVLHGDAGPGSAWAERATVGDVVGFRRHYALYAPRRPGHVLLVADETGAPALAGILQQVGTDHSTVLVESPDADHLAPLPDHPDLHVVHRHDRFPGTAAREKLASLRFPELSYAWICAEHALATGARRHLVRERGMAPADVMFSAFWTLGEPRI